MKRTVFILTAFLAVMSCTRTQDLDVPDAAQDAVSFDVYTHGALETKAGYPGEINLDALKVTGFGVYGYISSKPDFMANQHVTYSGSWVYSPVKYWPKQDNVNIDFYAYAPYVEQSDFAALGDAQADAALAEPTKEGIVYIHPNNVATTPKIVYRTPKDPSNSVDLMFGVAAEAHTSPVVTAGLPFLNMTKLKLGEKMKFNFKHALTKLVVNVDGYFDEVNGSTPGNNNVDPNTRVVIKSVNIKTTQLAVGGTLDLNNTVANTPNWTVGTTLSAFNASAGYDLPIASYLKYIEDNTESVTHFSQQPLGVTKTTQSLMGYGIDGTTAASLLFVPAGDAADLTITITYEVITRDPNLGKGYSITENPVTSTIAAANLGANAFKAVYATTLNLHLGLASVKFDATITDWETGETENVDLPKNVQAPFAFTASAEGKKVEFSRANLSYNISEGKWALLDKPYTVVETEGQNVGDNYADQNIVTLFGWGTSGCDLTSIASGWTKYQPWITDNSSSSGYGANYDLTGDYKNGDWGVYNTSDTRTIEGLSGSGWRVPSRLEWQYIVKYRPAEKVEHKFAKVKISDATPVSNQRGLILFPDEFDFTGMNASEWKFDTKNSNFEKTISLVDWVTLEAQGCVFLPSALIRSGTTITNDYNRYSTRYWSSTHNDASSSYAYWFQDSTVEEAIISSFAGCPVRLIRDIN